jgi:uncharacterized RDD family membrane protein YckC
MGEENVLMELEVKNEIVPEKLYAGFWPRAGAYIIDWIISTVLALIIAEAITFISLTILNMKGVDTHYFVMVKNYPALIGVWVTVIVYILYFSLMDSSKKQATYGKRIFKIQAVNMELGRLSLLRAVIKYLIMWPISFLILGSQFFLPIMLLMAIPIIFTTKKQGLYDMISGCLVINKNAVEGITESEPTDNEEKL